MQQLHHMMITVKQAIQKSFLAFNAVLLVLREELAHSWLSVSVTLHCVHAATRAS